LTFGSPALSSAWAWVTNAHDWPGASRATSAAFCGAAAVGARKVPTTNGSHRLVMPRRPPLKGGAVVGATVP
jgi:hypothetical protein